MILIRKKPTSIKTLVISLFNATSLVLGPVCVLTFCATITDHTTATTALQVLSNFLARGTKHFVINTFLLTRVFGHVLESVNEIGVGF